MLILTFRNDHKDPQRYRRVDGGTIWATSILFPDNVSRIALLTI